MKDEGKRMGRFCWSVTVRGPSQHDVLRYLRAVERDAYVSPSVDDATVVYDRANVPDRVVFTDEYRHVLALLLSDYFMCPSLYLRVDDSDTLSYHLYNNGRLIDRYYSRWPPWLPENAPGLQAYEGSGGAEKLCAAFSVLESVRLVDEILPHRNIWIDDLQRDLVNALHLPEFAAWYRYDSVDYCKSVGGQGCLDTVDWSSFINTKS